MNCQCLYIGPSNQKPAALGVCVSLTLPVSRCSGVFLRCILISHNSDVGHQKYHFIAPNLFQMWFVVMMGLSKNLDSNIKLFQAVELPVVN